MANAKVIVRLTAPSAWASCLINGDASGLDTSESEAIEAWLIREGLDSPVDCEDAGFLWHHDAFKECPLGADCQTYTFILTV